VYHGPRAPSLQGAYLYADYCSGRIWSYRTSSGSALVLDTAYSISSFGEDWDGEVYVADLSGGGIYRFAESGVPSPTSTPTATPIGTATPTATATPTTTSTPTPTQVTGSVVGGRDFTVAPGTNNIGLSWTAGTAQAGYYLARDPTASWVLSAAATSQTDAAPAS